MTAPPARSPTVGAPLPAPHPRRDERGSSRGRRPGSCTHTIAAGGGGVVGRGRRRGWQAGGLPADLWTGVDGVARGASDLGGGAARAQGRDETMTRHHKRYSTRTIDGPQRAAPRARACAPVEFPAQARSRPVARKSAPPNHGRCIRVEPAATLSAPYRKLTLTRTPERKPRESCMPHKNLGWEYTHTIQHTHYRVIVAGSAGIEQKSMTPTQWELECPSMLERPRACFAFSAQWTRA
jgi:hypothetical protein